MVEIKQFWEATCYSWSEGDDRKTVYIDHNRKITRSIGGIKPDGTDYGVTIVADWFPPGYTPGADLYLPLVRTITKDQYLHRYEWCDRGYILTFDYHPQVNVVTRRKLPLQYIRCNDEIYFPPDIEKSLMQQYSSANTQFRTVDRSIFGNLCKEF